jgi:XTP/dITP diphosphohydrolase
MPSPSLPARRTVVVATANRGKIRELRSLLASLPLHLVSMGDVSSRPIEIVEDGDTFEANARKKARAVAASTALPTLADDSGLEVDALDGLPGVRSARYAGERATDAENNRKLLAALEALGPGAPRTARFRCAMVFFDPTRPDAEVVTDGACEGRISGAPRGAGGFGYDPIFLVADAIVPPPFAGKTMAELPDDEKNRISHRARAIERMVPHLRDWLAR